MPRPLPAPLSAFVFVSGLVAALILNAAPASAHHNAHWSQDKHVSLSGTIISTYIGYPHSIMKLKSGKQIWSLYIGQPWHIKEIGLPVDALVPGTLVEVVGSPTEAGHDHQLKVTKMQLANARYVF